MMLRFLLFALASFANGVHACPADAQIDASTRSQPEVSREDIDLFILRAGFNSAPADLLRAMHEAYQLGYDAAWRVFRADFARDQQAAFEAGDRGDESEQAHLGEALRAHVASWRRERSRLLLAFLGDSAVALSESHAGAWDAFARSTRRARLMEELDPHALDPDIFDLEAQIELIELNQVERAAIEELFDQYRGEMDAIIPAIEARFDDWYELSQQPELDEESRARLSADLEQWRAQVRAINAKYLPLAAATMVEHRPEFDAMESGRRNPALFVTTPVERVMALFREKDILAAERTQALEEAYATYLGRRASLRRQFLQGHARWLPGTEARWAKRDELLRLAGETGQRIDANEVLHGHPGMPAMAEMFMLEESTLAGIRRELTDSELGRLPLEARILLSWPR